MSRSKSPIAQRRRLGWEDHLGWSEDRVHCHAFPAAGEGAPASGSAGAPAVSVLLVDDHEDTNRSLVLLLKRRGYAVQSATSLAAAEVLCGLGRFDVLVCDMSLPDGSGLDLLGRLGDKGPRFGAIMLSGYSTDDDIDRSLALGYKAHLSKPFEIDKLDAAIKRVVC